MTHSRECIKAYLNLSHAVQQNFDFDLSENVLKDEATDLNQIQVQLVISLMLRIIPLCTFFIRKPARMKQNTRWPQVWGGGVPRNGPARKAQRPASLQTTHGRPRLAGHRRGDDNCDTQQRSGVRESSDGAVPRCEDPPALTHVEHPLVPISHTQGCSKAGGTWVRGRWVEAYTRIMCASC